MTGTACGAALALSEPMERDVFDIKSGHYDPLCSVARVRSSTGTVLVPEK